MTMQRVACVAVTDKVTAIQLLAIAFNQQMYATVCRLTYGFWSNAVRPIGSGMASLMGSTSWEHHNAAARHIMHPIWQILADLWPSSRDLVFHNIARSVSFGTRTTSGKIYCVIYGDQGGNKNVSLATFTQIAAH